MISRHFELEPIRQLRTKVRAKLAEIKNTAATRNADGGKWISASEAVKIAERQGVTLALSTITKLSKREKPPFKSRPKGKNRREVHLESFFSYLDTQSSASPEAAFDEIERRKQELHGKKKQERGNLD